MFRPAVQKFARNYILPTLAIGTGVASSSYFYQHLQSNNVRPAYALSWGFGSSSTPAPQEVVGTASQVLPQTMAMLNDAAQNPTHFQKASTPLDRVCIKENLPALLQGTDITIKEVRQRLEKYTEGELKDSLTNGQSRAWVQLAIEDIKRDKLLKQSKESPEAFQRFQNYMLHTEVIPVNKGVIEEIHICQYQANSNMEDTYCFVKDLHSSKGSVIGVFDGHSGRDSATYCAKNLVAYLDFFKYYGLSQDFMDPNVIQIADDHYIDLAIGQNAYKALTGACLLLTQITNTALNTLWAGDCRALLIRDNTTKYSGPLPQQHPLHSDFVNPPIVTHALPVDGTVSGYQGDFTELTVPHQIDLNYYEKQRLINEHPGEPDVIARDRVKGGLQPTRAFGDAHYKKMAYYRLKYPERSMDNWFPPYITAKPDHSHYQLNQNDRYIVLSSDGLLDALSPLEVTSIIHTAPQTMPAARVNNIATYLTTQALYQTGKVTMNNAATLDQISQLLPRLGLGKERRRIHDDITVLVVKLRPEEIGNEKSDRSPYTPESKPPVPSNLREAIKRGLLTNSSNPGGEFLNTGIVMDIDPSKGTQMYSTNEALEQMLPGGALKQW